MSLLIIIVNDYLYSSDDIKVISIPCCSDIVWTAVEPMDFAMYFFITFILDMILYIVYYFPIQKVRQNAASMVQI